MTYLVFALIVAAALCYLILSDSRILRTKTLQSAEYNRLQERLESIKLSLRDIEYEKTVGKMDLANFNRLQNEFLTEWDTIEKKLTALKVEEPAVAASAAKFCSSCGTAIATLTAKFCHACGTKLPLALLIVCILFLASTPNLNAFDIHVTIQNGTTARVETAPLNVQLLKLEQGMQPVTAKAASNGKAQFLNLPEMTAAPYMVQVVYRGITYSKAIPPNMQSPAEVKLDVFESTASTERLRVRTLIELRRSEKGMLTGLMILFFVNTDTRAFIGGKNGLEFFLPPTAEIEQASVSVGTGASNIQWLKLSPTPGSQKGFYTAGQNVKPGDRILQVMFRMPYDEKGTLLNFQSLYPQDTGIQLIAEPENIEVKQGQKLLSRIRDEGLGRGLISFLPRESHLEVALSGGSIAAIKKTEEAEIEIKSPLSLTQKLLFPLVAVLIFATGVWAKSRRDQASL